MVSPDARLKGFRKQKRLQRRREDEADETNDGNNGAHQPGRSHDAARRGPVHIF